MVLALVVIAAPATALAGDLDDFVFARDAYNNSDYDIAIQRLQGLLDRRPPIDSSLAEAVRKYLFASLLLTDHRDQAVAMVEQILRNNPDVQFAARDFSGAVVQLVNETRGRLAIELDRIRTERVVAASLAQETRDRERQALIEALSRERVTVRIARPWMFIPFGVGQFANGSYGVGALFASIESLALATAIVSYGIEAAAGIPVFRPDTYACRISFCTPLMVTNTLGWALFGVAAIAGIVQANIAWQPERYEYRRRRIPPDLLRVQLSAAPMPDGLAVGASWRF